MDYNWSKKKPAAASIFVSLIIHRSATLAVGHNLFTLDPPACSGAVCELHLAQRQEIH
jgi:hypothetical protein